MNETLLTANNLQVRFGGVLAVNKVSFDVQRGEVFTLIGPNGAGKTTVFNLISRIYTPTAGEIHFEGRALASVPPHEVASLGIARTFQNIELFEHATVLQNLLIGRHIRRRTSLWQEMLFLPAVRDAERETRRKVEEVIDFLDLQRHRDSMVAGLPYGVRKVVELARALATGPKLLLLDEPSSGLNVEETEDMAFWIQDIRDDLGITVLMVEHDMTLVSRVSDRVLAMNQGEVLALGTPREVQSHAGVIEAYLGTADDATSLRRRSTPTPTLPLPGGGRNALDLLLGRQSLGGKHLVEPGPDDAALALMAEAALRAPDHAELVPFRFAAVRGAARERLAELFADAARDAGKSDEAVAIERERALATPVTVALLARIDMGHPLVPAHEQWCAVGGALANFLHAAHLLGYAGKMLSGHKVRHAAIQAAFCEPGETLVGWVVLGTAQRVPGARTPKAGAAAVLRPWLDAPGRA